MNIVVTDITHDRHHTRITLTHTNEENQKTHYECHLNYNHGRLRIDKIGVKAPRKRTFNYMTITKEIRYRHTYTDEEYNHLQAKYRKKLLEQIPKDILNFALYTCKERIELDVFE